MMRNNKLEKKKLVLWVCLLLTIGLGLGYALLTEQLKLIGSVNYGAMSIDVGFTTAEDGGGTVTSSPSVSNDKKSVTVTCNVGTSTSSETCIAKAKIKNASSFAVELESDPTISYDNTYISSVTAVWTGNSANVIAGDSLGSNVEEEITITITTKELTKEMLPESTLSLPVTITMDWIESGSNNTGIAFANKKAIFLGDSVAYGHQTGGNGFGYYINQQEAFLSYTNAAVNSATLNTTTQGTNNVIEQIKKNKNNEYDFVIIEGGYGDLRDTPPLGTITEGHNPEQLDTTTFAGAIEYTLYLAKITWPNARIGFIVSYDVPKSNSGVRPDHDATKEYWDIAKAACDKWKIPYLDFFEGSTSYNGVVKTYSELFDVTGNTYIADGVHPSAAGYEFITPFIKDWMKTLPVTEYVISDGIYTIVRKFNDLSFTPGVSLKSDGNMEWGDAIGRASAVNYLVAVEGGASIGLSSSANNVTYAIKEYDETKTYNSSGEAHSRWISEDITLHPSTKYIVVTFKNGDGSSNFTEEQLSLLPTYLEFK